MAGPWARSENEILATLQEFVPAMEKKGRIRVGADADITVFDAETVIDRATYLEGSLVSDGIEYVLVNGRIVVDQGQHTGVLAGRGLRHGRA